MNEFLIAAIIAIVVAIAGWGFYKAYGGGPDDKGKMGDSGQ